MKAISISIAALALAITATSASAVTIANRDARAYQLKVLEGGKTRTVEIQPNEEVRDICTSNCKVTVEGDSEPYDLEVADNLMIEEGELYIADEGAAGSDTDAAPQQQ